MVMWKNGNQPLVYLAGAIEHAPDNGRHWRTEISRFLMKELHHRVFNPCLEESHILSPDEFRNFRDWKTTDISRFRQVMHKIIQTDISMLINEVDYIICLWDQYVTAGGGTQGELTMAFWHRIPVYMISQVPVQEMSSWILGCTTELFRNKSELTRFLYDKYMKLTE
ncbi:MAG: hypothetical protein JSW33_14160 [bacterium]|nr:MAG: hypothetical protein JSW33_14160 [bacterium]